MKAIKRQVDMVEFDKLVLSAALVKRKDIIERCGHEGCEKLLAKGAGRVKKEDSEYMKMTFENTILELLEGMDAFVWYRPKNTKNTKEQARCWDCDEGIQCKDQSRRHSMHV